MSEGAAISARPGRHWLVAPGDRELGVVSTALVLVVAGCALAIAVRLRAENLFPTGPFGTDTHLVGAPFLLQVGALLLGMILLQVLPARFSRGLLIGEGFVCLFAFGATFALASIAALVAYYWALRIPLRGRARALLAVGMLLCFGLVGASQLLGEGPIMFSAIFCLRLLLFGWQRWQEDAEEYAFVDYLVFVLVAPLVFFLPYMLFIPFPSRFAEKMRPRLTETRARTALVQIALAGVMFGLASLGRAASACLPDVAPATIAASYVLQVLTLAFKAHFIVALLLLHGVEDRMPLMNPFLATDYGDFWRRFQVHQKDVQVSLFYNPTLIALRRKNRYLAIALAVTVALFVGNPAIHLVSRYLYDADWVTDLTSRLPFYSLSTLVLALTLCLQEWRRRARRPAPSKGWGGRAYVAVCWACTHAFNAFIYSLP